MMAGYRVVFRMFLLSFLFIFLLMMVVVFTVFSHQEPMIMEDLPASIGRDHDGFERQGQGGMWDYEIDLHGYGSKGGARAEKEEIPLPIILWWTDFLHEKASIKKCGDVRCFFTNDRHYKDHKGTKVFLFYGTSFDPVDLPVPRRSHHEWALLHEESPKNQYLYSFEDVMGLFNHTATFKEESDYPIPTQWLQSIEALENQDYFVPTKEKMFYQGDLAPVNFVHSDCNTPSDRDHLMKMLQQYIKVDSFGKCEHNKDLAAHISEPLKGMDHKDFYKLMAKYKFTLATENAVCDGYMTEKLWRPLMLGSVPIVLGSPRVKEYLPNNHSAIHVSDFRTVKELADYLHFLNTHDEEYDKYLAFKKTGVTNEKLKRIMASREWGGVDKPREFYHYTEAFECFICKRLHANQEREKLHKPIRTHVANEKHYGCPAPKRFPKNGSIANRYYDKWWASEYWAGYYHAKTLKHFIGLGRNYTKEEFYAYSQNLINASEKRLPNV